ncbi:MAG TPA: hypothetical protein VF004_13940 [Burkholderiales bacterium]
MKFMIWLLTLAAIGVFGYAIWLWLRRLRHQQRSSEERMAAFMAEVKPAAVPPPASDLPQQKLLFEAAAKAAEAGEPVLSIQLYARLLARFPDSVFAAQARAAVEAQKLKLAKP